MFRKPYAVWLMPHLFPAFFPDIHKLNWIGESLHGAFALASSGDARLWAIIFLSLQVSLTAMALAAVAGCLAGAAVAVGRFPGRRLVIVSLNAAMGLPPVVVGLVVYLLLSRAGPLGSMGLLFTPGAMVIAQFILIAPIIAALSRAWILQPGDLVFTGSPAGVSALQRGDAIACGVDGLSELRFSGLHEGVPCSRTSPATDQHSSRISNAR